MEKDGALTKLKIKGLRKTFGGSIIFDDFTLEIPRKKITCILGVSGIGKTTLLNILSGLTSFDRGDISDFTGKTFSYIFQEPRLLQWKTVSENIVFVLKDRYSLKKSVEIADKYLEMVGLSDFKGYYPGAISGGMEQRVSIARAFAFSSEILIMDEPFKSLDYKLKKNLMNIFSDLWENDRRTVIFVTHDIEEAAYLGEHILILEEHKPARLKAILNIPVSAKERLSDYSTVRQIKKQLIDNI
jgi:NitT/TauT family transport system ATP-binding protein